MASLSDKVTNAAEDSGEPVLSIILPTLNEAETLDGVFSAVGSEKIRSELIVVDAGSCDDTVAIARSAGARVLTSARPQRGLQLNVGARHARGEILLFLHADTRLPFGALDHITQTLDDPTIIGGAFARRYDSKSIVLRATCWLAGWRNRTVGWHLGDQAMFVRRSAFFQLGGFREVDMFEDVDFSRRLKRFGRIVTLLPRVISSSRRFARVGPARTTLRDLRLTARYLLGGLEPFNSGRPTATSPPTYHARKSAGEI